MTCILINTVFLLIDNYDKGPILSNVLDTANLIFIPIFTLEMLLKMIAYGIKFYFYVNWNKLDFCIVIFSFMSLFEGLLASIKINVTVLRILRVARLLRVIKTSDGLRQLIKTLYISISNMVTTSFLLILVLFTYSVIGMSILDDV
jgi:Ion transport protein